MKGFIDFILGKLKNNKPPANGLIASEYGWLTEADILEMNAPPDMSAEERAELFSSALEVKMALLKN